MRYPTCITKIATAFFALLVLALAPAAANATAVSYTADFNPHWFSSNPQISIDGDTVMQFKGTARASKCSTDVSNSQHDFAVRLPDAPVKIVNNVFQFQTVVHPAYYTGDEYSGVAIVTGALSPDRSQMTGTVTMIDADDPFVDGCSAHYTFLAVPASFAAEYPGFPDKQAFTSNDLNLSFDYEAREVTNFHLQANFTCSDGGMDAATIVGDHIGFKTIHTAANGAFSIHSYVIDEYDQVLMFDLTGTIGKSHASGTYTVSTPPGYATVFESTCSETKAWSADKPGPPKPSATFDLAAARITVGGHAKYYFYALNLNCSHGANAVRFTVAHHVSTVRCRRGAGFASHSLRPAHVYTIRAQAVRIKHHRVVKRGVRESDRQKMPSADRGWAPFEPSERPPS